MLVECLNVSKFGPTTLKTCMEGYKLWPCDELSTQSVCSIHPSYLHLVMSEESFNEQTLKTSSNVFWESSSAHKSLKFVSIKHLVKLKLQIVREVVTCSNDETITYFNDMLEFYSETDSGRIRAWPIQHKSVMATLNIFTCKRRCHCCWWWWWLQ